ncbi:MAG: hypothetical protein KC776_38870 [Myxococcales bacterium]|nr:hypothetical protein [Myxococcales bacterium]MCB9583123.1 hypothetical protein [Polyangiaceae bacterium]
MRRFAQFLAAIAVALSPALARAQACCTATGTSGFGVVGRCHFAVLAAQLSYERGHGSFDANGDYHPLSHAEVDDVVLSLAGGIRLGTPKLQVYGSIPLRLQYRDLEGLSSDSAVGPGDASLALRAMALEDLVTGIQWSDARSFLPFVEPYVGGRAPTGKGPTESDRPSGVDATGDGTWTAFAGVSVTKFVTLSDAVVLDGSYGYRFEHDVSSPSGGSRRYSPGNEIRGRLALVHVVNLFWSGSVFASAIASTNARQDGNTIPNSGTRRVRVGASVQYYVVYPYWEVGASVSADPPVSGLGKNIPFAGANASLMLQRNFTW